MEKIKKLILSIVPDAVAEEAQYPTFTVDASKIRSVAEKLKEKGFDYLICLTGMDYGDSLGCIYHISSSTDKTSVIVLKTSTSDRQNPAIPSFTKKVCMWVTVS